MKPDIKAALDHIELAAKAGVVAAQNQLGILYVQGDGVKTDPETAMMWFYVAAAIGDPQALSNRNAYAARVDKQTLVRARKRANAFRPQSLTPNSKN